MTTKSLQDDNTTDLDKLIEDFENYELGHRIATDNRRAEFIKSIKHLILKAELNLAIGLTMGGSGGTELFYQNTPIESYIEQLKSELGDEGK